MQKRLTDLRAGFNEMFTVIEHEQQSFGAQMINQNFERTAMTVLTQIENGKQGLRYKCWICNRCKFCKPYAVRKLIQTFGAHLQTKTCLASTAWACKCHKTMFIEGLFDFCQFLLAPNKTRHLSRNIMTRYIKCFNWRKIAGKICDNKLINMFGMDHILQLPFTHVA